MRLLGKSVHATCAICAERDTQSTRLTERGRNVSFGRRQRVEALRKRGDPLLCFHHLIYAYQCGERITSRRLWSEIKMDGVSMFFSRSELLELS